MKRALELSLIEAALAGSGRGPVLDSCEHLVATADYADPQVFELERARLLRPRFSVVGLSTAVPRAGDFVTVEVMGTPAIVVRGDDGTVRAFVNVCRHRGARVEAQPHGHCKRFVCPYHAWTYGRDGQLEHVRHASAFPQLRVEDTTLAPLPCVEAAGLLWVCPGEGVCGVDLDDATRCLVDELEGLVGPEPTAFASSERTWAANWKLITDGGLESYHFRIAHRDSIGGSFGDTNSSYAFIGDHVRTVLPRVSLASLAELPRERWHLREHANILYTIAPNATVLVQPRHFELILATPIAVDRTHVEVTTVGRAPGPGGYSENARAFLQANHTLTVRTLAEDFELAEQIHAGLRTGVNDHFRFGRCEGALSQWHRRRAEALGRPLPTTVRATTSAGPRR
ncbi:MAG: aromatic ring-hydroxylating dioxygenase subunit alpha [Myxococcota bacterium]